VTVCALDGSRRRLRWAIGRGTLIAPVVVIGTDASPAKHDSGTNGNSEASYSAGALSRLLSEAVRRIAGALLHEGALSYDAHAKLLATSAHAFRFTIVMPAVARDMPIDVVQRIRGHAALQPTSIYAQADRQRVLDAAAQYDAVPSEVGIAKSAAAETIDAFLGAVTNAVVKGDPVYLTRFRSVSAGARAARTCRNPTTREALQIATSTTFKFTIGKAFKDAVSK
jgi:nucleoid DNA-binding protein